MIRIQYTFKMAMIAVRAVNTRARNLLTNGAKNVIALIAKINNGQSFKGGEKTGLGNYIKNWQND